MYKRCIEYKLECYLLGPLKLVANNLFLSHLQTIGTKSYVETNWISFLIWHNFF